MPRSVGLDVAADDFLDAGNVLVADLKARAAGHAHVDDELAGIGARKISAAEERKENKRRQRDAAKDDAAVNPAGRSTRLASAS